MQAQFAKNRAKMPLLSEISGLPGARNGPQGTTAGRYARSLHRSLVVQQHSPNHRARSTKLEQGGVVRVRAVSLPGILVIAALGFSVDGLPQTAVTVEGDALDGDLWRVLRDAWTD